MRTKLKKTNTTLGYQAGRAEPRQVCWTCMTCNIHLLVAPARLIGLGIGQNMSCVLNDCLKFMPEGCSPNTLSVQLHVVNNLQVHVCVYYHTY